MPTSTPTKGVAAKESKTKLFCNKLCILVTVSIVLLLFGIGLIIQIIFINPEIKTQFHDAVSDRLYMTQKKHDKNTTNYQKWVLNIYKDTPIEEFTYYLYNITNPREVLDGSWPKLEQVGPFKFLRYEHRTNVRFDNNSCIVSYTYKYTYDFLADESYNKNARITILNPNILPIFYNSIYSNDLQTKTIAQQLLTFGLQESNLFVFLEAYQLFRGFSTQWVEDLSTDDKSNISWYTILTDERNITQYTGNCKKRNAAEIIDIDNSSSVNFWRTPEYLNGTREIKVWPYNYVKKDESLNVYGSPIYRAIPYEFEKSFKEKGVKLWRYRASENIYLSSDNYPQNDKYYQNGKDGLFNLTMKSYPNPAFAFLSLDKFHKADYYYNKYGKPTGLRKTIEEEESSNGLFLDIEPKSGVVFRTKLQLMSSYLLYKPQSFNSIPGPFSNINESECYVALYSVTVDIYAHNRVYTIFRRKFTLINDIRLVSNYVLTSFGGFVIVIAFISLGIVFKKLMLGNEIEGSESENKGLYVDES